jgi:CRP-like cAMP-binding protein
MELKKESKSQIHKSQLKRKNLIEDINLELDTVVVNFRGSPEYQGYTFLIYPDDKFKIFWDFFIILLVLYTLTIYIYRVSFSDIDSYSWVIFEYTVDFFFFLDCLFSFITCYYDSSSHLIIDRTLIALRYLKGWFFIDALGFFPFEVITNQIVGSENPFSGESMNYYRSLRILKMIRITKFWNSEIKIQEIEEFLRSYNIKISRMSILCLCFLFFCHVVCCLWCLCARSWAGPINWESKYLILDFTEFDKYLASLYWVITTVCTIGYGDIMPGNNLERGVTICVMSGGVFFYSYTISSITSYMASNSYQNSKIKEHSDVLQSIAIEYKLPKGFHKRLNEALIYNLKEKRSDFLAFLNSLPAKTASKLKYAMNSKLLEGNEFFKDKPFHFIQKILEFLMPYKVEADEFIYKEGYPCDEIYFVLSGEVVFVYEDNIIYESVGSGGYFGDAEIFLCEERETSVKSIERTKMLTLDRDILMSTLKDYEKLKVDMIIMSMIKRKQLKKTSIMTDSYETSQDIQISPLQLSFPDNIPTSSEQISVNFIEDCSSSLEPKIAWIKNS